MICYFCAREGYDCEIVEVERFRIGPNSFTWVHVDSKSPWCDGGNAWVATPSL